MKNDLRDTTLFKWAPMIAALLFVMGMWSGYLLADGDDITPAQQKLNNILSLIEDEYVDEVDIDSLVEATIPSLLEHLDPHTVYIPYAETERFNRDVESSFYGVGISYEILNDTVCVVEVVQGSPAQRQGVQPGDRLLAVDNRSLGSEVTADEMADMLRGEKDSPVKIKLYRPSANKKITMTLLREEIPSLSIDAAYMINDSVGYVRINKFAYNTYPEFLQAASSLSARGATGFILDLRDNSGGLVDQAILLVNEFLPPMQTIVETRGRHSRDNSIWRSDGTGDFADASLVVLVNEFTASSSEIVAGAIQDNDRGLIVGRRSFGKGLVQLPVVLPDSSQIRLTVQRYYTPSGRSIQKNYSSADADKYDRDIADRYLRGEAFHADSVKLDSLHIFHTSLGRPVYGGGGIMPDIFVPTDTTGLSSYYFQVSNAGLLNRFAFEYVDLNRANLSKAKTTAELTGMLPDENILLWSFVRYATSNGIPQRWYYINNSAKLIVNQLKALIARDVLGLTAYYEISNSADPTVEEALRQMSRGVDNTIMSAVE